MKPHLLVNPDVELKNQVRVEIHLVEEIQLVEEIALARQAENLLEAKDQKDQAAPEVIETIEAMKPATDLLGGTDQPHEEIVKRGLLLTGIVKDRSKEMTFNQEQRF